MYIPVGIYIGDLLFFMSCKFCKTHLVHGKRARFLQVSLQAVQDVCGKISFAALFASSLARILLWSFFRHVLRKT